MKRDESPSAPPSARPPSAPLPRGSERILLVEDNEHVRAMAGGQLVSLGYAVVEVESGDAAVVLLESTDGAFDLVFSDIRMPGKVDGFDLAFLVLERWPRIRVMLASGFSGDVAAELEEKERGTIILRKPYRKADLARAVRDRLAG